MQGGAITAYNAGATGAGVIAAVVDSGIASGNPEFAGRIHASSTDLAGTRGIEDVGGHGTAVSSILLGAKNDSGTHGVAFGATLLVARTDTAGSCTDPDPDAGCTHGDNAIARGVDLAVTTGAKVINISLGGSPANTTLRNAIDRATAAGVIIVFSAGNEFDTDPATAINPDPLALIANESIARGLVIIAGALDSSNSALTAFSNRAGTGQTHYLSALGSRVRSIDETGSTFLFSGTSFSAPVIAGAVALLAQAFPNLTPTQIVTLLFSSATDLGAAGVDGTFGFGALNITRAFQPQGQTSLAGSTISVSEGLSGALSTPMGDASKGGASAIILDDLGRAFAINLDATVGVGSIAPRLAPGLGVGARSFTGGAAGAAVSLSVAAGGSSASVERLLLSPHEERRTRALAGAMFARLGRNTVAGMGIMKSGASLGMTLSGDGASAFLIGDRAGEGWGFNTRAKSAIAIRHGIGPTSVTLSAESGDAQLWQRNQQDSLGAQYPRSGYSALNIGVARSFGALSLKAGLSLLDEQNSILGARFGSFAGTGGAQSLFADAGTTLALGRGWSVGGAWRQGWTRVAAGGLRQGPDRLVSSAWSLDLAKTALIGRSDRLGLRLSQPLRISRGGFDLTVPVSYDYATLGVGYANRFFNLAPTGREIDAEAVWSARVGKGWMSANLFWRRDPGNFAAAPDDKGMAVRYTLGL